nr:hypothetical protein [Tanacetum cinerariifolium]
MPETFDLYWNTVKTIDDVPKQSLFNEMIQAGGSKDKSKKKSLMRVDEIPMFCDKILQSVCNTFRERILNFNFGYTKGMRLREWTVKDKRRTCIMLKKIDDHLFKR